MPTTMTLPYDAYEVDPDTADTEHAFRVVKMGRIDGFAVWAGVFEEGPLECRGAMVAPGEVHALLARTLVEPEAGFIIAVPLWRVISVRREEAEEVEVG